MFISLNMDTTIIQCFINIINKQYPTQQYLISNMLLGIRFISC